MERGENERPFVPRRDPLIGRQLGEFVVRERIGEGGFGAVYRAHQAALGREAVIKVLRVGRRADDTTIRRFTAEAQVASRLDHPYAAHIYGFGAEDDGLLWIAMELVRGSALDHLLTLQGPIPLDRFVPFFERVCEVVHTAHEQAIVHRDIKPANIMVLSRAGRLLPKLLDFGIAKVLTSALLPPSAVAVAQTLPGRPLDPNAGGSGLDKTAPLGEAAVPASIPVSSDTGNEILGSPRYMAPEQWVSPGDVDARTDLYALGAVAFEALTGKPAFDGATIPEVMAAHTGAIPRLPTSFPPALDSVLARALAKQQSQRFSSALELAEAFRNAAGLRSEKHSVPALDRKVRNRFVERAPEPIADAIAAYESAENPHAARDALWQIARSIARWIGVLALSCRSRVGASGPESASVARRLSALRRDGLEELEWVDLARELVRPFEAKRDAYPIPELVAAFFPHDGEPDAGALLERLLRHPSSTDPAGSLSIRLGEAVKQLADALGALWFLTEYEVIVPRGGRGEWFRGVRRVPRDTALAPDLVEHDGKPLVLDGEGQPVLVLWPLVQCDAPSAGADRELFLFDGPGRSGARLVAPRHAFEIHDGGLWEWFRKSVFALDPEPADPATDVRPYRGLSAFTADDAALFYGREREVDAFVNRLRVTPLLAVVGPSGAGKSSFVQAGALPALGWKSVIMRPGSSPFAALAARLGDSALATKLSARPELLGELLRADPAGTVLVVDQLEELFTLCSDADERTRFGRMLAAMARSPDDRVRVIVTLRDDFLMRAEALPALSERLAAGLHLLGTPKRDDLVRILVEPARRAGYEFEEAALPEEMVTAVAGQPGALALLSFTAAALWDLRDRHFHQLTHKAYQAIGGVGGALARHAEETLAAMPPDQRLLVREAFRRLVTAEGTRAVMTRRELVQVLGANAKAESVIEALVTARLLAVSEAEDGERLEVTHEALLSAWPRVVEWRREDAAGARMRDQIRSAARQWDDRGRPAGLLWHGDALAEFQIWRARTPGSLTEIEEAFTKAAEQQAKRGRLLRRTALATAFAFLAGALGVVLWLNARTQRERERAVHSLADLYEEQGRAALLDHRPGEALVYLVAARRQGASSAALDVMLAAAARPLEAGRLVLDHGDQVKVWSIAYSHDGRHLVTASGDGKARLWNATTGALERELVGHSRDVKAASFSPDDSAVLTQSFDGTARMWNVDTGKQIGACGVDAGVLIAAALADDGTRIAIAGGDRSNGTGLAKVCELGTGRTAMLPVASFVKEIAWSHDGTRLVTAGNDGAAVWDVTTGARVASFLSGATVDAVFSADDRRVLTASSDGTAALWDVAAATAPVVRYVGHSAALEHVELSPDGTRVVTSSKDKTARIWKTTGELVAALTGHGGDVHVATFSPSGERVITAGADGMIRLWSSSTGTLIGLRDGHSNQIYSAVFRRDGAELATAAWDGTARTWTTEPDFEIVSEDLGADVIDISLAPDGRLALATSTGDNDGELAGTIRGTPPVVATASWRRVAFDPVGRQLVAIDAAGGAALWATDGRERQRLDGHVGPVTRAKFSADGATVVTAGEDGTVRVWDTATGRQRQLLDVGKGLGVRDASLRPDGRAVVTASVDGVVRTWDTATAALTTAFPGSKGWVFGAEYAHDGRRIVSAHQDIVARIWEAATGRLIGTLTGHGEPVVAAHFSPDDALVVTASDDRTVRIWDPVRARMLLVFEGHAGWVTAAWFTAGGDEVVSASRDHTVRRWRVSREVRSTEVLEDLARCRVGLVINATNSLTAEPVDRSRCR